MLGKLIKYDMSALSRILGPLQGIALIVALVAAAFGLVGYWTNEVSLLSFGLEEIVEIFAGMGVIVGALAIACLIPATLVIILHRFYTNFYTDQGYLTFTLPVKASDLLWSKVIAGALWTAIAGLVSLAGMLLVNYAIYGFTSEASLTSTMPYWILSGDFDIFGMSEADAFAPLVMLGGCVRTYLSIFAVLMMAFTGFALGATWARQHKVICGIALFLALWVGLSMVWGTVTIFAATMVDMVISDGSYTSSQVVNGMQYQLAQGLDVLRNVIVCVGGFLICYVCLRKHVNLS